MLHARFSLLALVVALVGCSSTEPRTEADDELRPLVRSWERLKTEGRHGLTQGEVDDPDLLRHRFEELAAIYPRHVPTLFANAVVAYDAKVPQAAQQYLDRVFAEHPVHPEAAILRARIAVEEGNLGHARKLLDEQIRLMPDHAGLRESRAGVHYAQSEYDEARLALDVAARLGAPAWRVAFNLGLIEEATGHPIEAAALYERVLAANESHAPARSRLNALRATDAPARPSPGPNPLNQEVEAARKTSPAR